MTWMQLSVAGQPHRLLCLSPAFRRLWPQRTRHLDDLSEFYMDLPPRYFAIWPRQ